ncbi:MAG: hypothetical protein LUD79_03775 [Oscillospiraceae bacterium]|nr:hypothetical protein [Oscillospiraceae bacterium]
MAERYVYTRAKSERGNSSGFTCRSEGIVGAVQKEIQALSFTEHEVRNYAGEYIPVWEKLALSGRQDKVILQRTTRRRTAEGIVQQACGYVLELNEEILVQPAAWGSLDFRIQEEPVRLPTSPAALEPLGKVLEFFDLNREQLLRLVKSCFDAKLCGSMCLVGVDFSRRGAVQMGSQLLMWVYSLLPFALRRELNCTTCFEGAWNSGYHLGLVPAALLEGDESRPAASVRRSFFAGSGILFYQGQVEYDPGTGRMRYGEQNGLYSQWLGSVIRQALSPENGRTEQLLAQIDAIYRRFDVMIRSLPEEDRYSPNYYDALCWNLMRQTDGAAHPISARSDLTCIEDLLAFGSWPEVLNALGDMLDVLERLYTTPATAQLIRLMTKIVQLDGANDTLCRARELFSAFLSRDMENAEMGESSAVSARYLQLMTANGMERGTALQFLSRVFFPETFAVSPDVAELSLWERVGTSRLPSEGLRRCNDWMSSYVNVCMNTEELIDCADTVIRELDGLASRLLEQALECLLGAQESRCYYARLEILPGHLTACCQCYADAWNRVPEQYRLMAERYYTRLLKLLCREYVRCWNGRSDLNSVCNLATVFRRDGWYKQGNSYLRELVLAHCADICEYDWEKLKERLNREDSGILQRLWQVLDLLEDLRADAEMKHLLTRQVCRYILHRVPGYVNDTWIVCEVREREDLRREGYYLELLTLREFLQGKEQTLERLQYCIKRNHVPTELMKDMMKFLYRVFQQGGTTRLSLTAVEGLFIGSRERLKISQLDVFRTVCQVRSGAALIQLLNCWPSAPEAQNLTARQRKLTEATRRKGAYPWLKTNKGLMEALMRLSQEKDVLAKAAQNQEDFYLAFAEAINELAPVGTKARPMAVKINGRLLALQEEQAGLKTRMACSARKRRLLAE